MTSRSAVFDVAQAPKPVCLAYFSLDADHDRINDLAFRVRDKDTGSPRLAAMDIHKLKTWLCRANLEVNPVDWRNETWIATGPNLGNIGRLRCHYAFLVKHQYSEASVSSNWDHLKISDVAIDHNSSTKPPILVGRQRFKRLRAYPRMHSHHATSSRVYFAGTELQTVSIGNKFSVTCTVRNENITKP